LVAEQPGSSRIRWHTSGHFAKIFMIICVRLNIYLYNIRFLIRLNDRKGLAHASFNTPTDRQWHFWQQYRAIFNLLSTFKSHYHIKCSRLNHIVKRIVEIDPYVEKIERFADWLLIWRPHKSKCNRSTSISLLAPGALSLLSFNFNGIIMKIRCECNWKVDYWLCIRTFKANRSWRQLFDIWHNLHCWPWIITSPRVTYNNQSQM
jgi:hypothetical protein